MHPATHTAGQGVADSRCCQKAENVRHDQVERRPSSLHIEAVLPHSATLPQECARASGDIMP
eukprot:928111-Pyramimonas_sp.AAC.1